MAMLPLLTIVGATGSQGGSILTHALKSKQYRIRAITRNTTSTAATKLSSLGVEVVAADLDDEASLVKAFEGSTAIYAMTNFFGIFPTVPATEAAAIETHQGINLARAALQTPTLEHYIWSTLPNASRISGGKYEVSHFMGKNGVDSFIKGEKKLWEKTTFLWVGYYAGNYDYPTFRPVFLDTAGKYANLLPISQHHPIPTIGDVNLNLGLFTTAILAQPSLTRSKIVLASIEETTFGKMLKLWSEVSGKEAVYVEIKGIEEYDRLWPQWGTVEGLMMKYWDECGKKAWDGEGVEVLGMGELGVTGSEVVGLKESLKGLYGV